jgi:sugar lactone lactonase YvrE
MKTFHLPRLLPVLLSSALALPAVSPAAQSESYEWANFAGMPGGQGNADGKISEARFKYPAAVVMDAHGNLYVADTENSTIRKITPDGVVTTLAGSIGGLAGTDGAGSAARFNRPAAMAVDAGGTLYVADTENSAIRKVSPDGAVTTLAGTPGQDGYTDAPGSAARFWRPQGVVVDPSGNLYVADTGNHCIRKITPAGAVSTLAGAGNPGSVDGKGSAAQFNRPDGVAIDGQGNLYVADTENQTIRTVTPDGVVATLAGSAGTEGSADGKGSAAQFNRPAALVVDANGTVYVADTENHTIRKVTPDGVVTTLAGSSGKSGCTDGQGGGARFSRPASLTLGLDGKLFLADSYNHAIRTVTPEGVVATLTGAGYPGSSDGTGNTARLKLPEVVAVDAAGNVYVADSGNCTVRKISPDGTVTTLAGSANKPGTEDGKGNAARFVHPGGIAVDAKGNVYVADSWSHTIRKVTPSGTVTTLAGSPGKFGSINSKGGEARFNGPRGIAVDKNGNLFVADSGNYTIRKVTPGGIVTTLVGSAENPGVADGKGTAAQFYYPIGVAVDAVGNVYVTDSWNHTIRKVTQDGAVTTLAGTAQSSGSDDGRGGAARFNRPEGIAADADGNVYVADVGNQTIRKVTSEGAVTTVGGKAGGVGSSNGTGATAYFSSPSGVAVTSTGILYVADQGNNRISVGKPSP